MYLQVGGLHSDQMKLYFLCVQSVIKKPEWCCSEFKKAQQFLRKTIFCLFQMCLTQDKNHWSDAGR